MMGFVSNRTREKIFIFRDISASFLFLHLLGAVWSPRFPSKVPGYSAKDLIRPKKSQLRKRRPPLKIVQSACQKAQRMLGVLVTVQCHVTLDSSVIFSVAR